MVGQVQESRGEGTVESDEVAGGAIGVKIKFLQHAVRRAEGIPFRLLERKSKEEVYAGFRAFALLFLLRTPLLSLLPLLCLFLFIVGIPSLLDHQDLLVLIIAELVSRLVRDFLNGLVLENVWIVVYLDLVEDAQ